MTLTVFLAVLGAAALHAAWNALVKGGTDMMLGMGALILGHAPMTLLCLIFAPSPAPESYPFIAAGIALHIGYQLFLIWAYSVGDLTQVYPIARGVAPLIVAGVSVLALGVALSGMELFAIGLIGAGILSLALVRRADGMRNMPAALLALVTGGFIASYSLVDGWGARTAGTALGYYAWLSIGNIALFALYLRWSRPGTLSAIPVRGKKAFLVGGTASFVAYAVVTWAFTQAPIALVTALRETSIVFALLIGVVFLRERLDLLKLFSTWTTLFGAALLRMVRV